MNVDTGPFFTLLFFLPPANLGRRHSMGIPPRNSGTQTAATRLQRPIDRYLSTIQDFVLKKKDYLMKQVGNPEGEDKPNKKVCSRRIQTTGSRLTYIAVLRSSCLGPGRRKDARRSRKGSLC